MTANATSSLIAAGASLVLTLVLIAVLLNLARNGIVKDVCVVCGRILQPLFRIVYILVSIELGVLIGAGFLTLLGGSAVLIGKLLSRAADSI